MTLAQIQDRLGELEAQLGNESASATNLALLTLTICVRQLAQRVADDAR